MKVLNRGLAILLAAGLILGSGAAFAVSPNANSKAKINPGRMKAMEKMGMTVLEKVDIVDEVKIQIIPMDNGNIGLIVGSVELEKGYKFEDFKGNLKIKIKLNNVTVNIDKNGEFMKSMPMWKIEPLSVRVYMGKILVYSDVEDDLDEIRDEIDLQRALGRAETLISRLPTDLDDLDIDDLKLVERARIAIDILKEVIYKGTNAEKALYEKYLDIVEKAEKIMWEIVSELVEWDREPVMISKDTFYGKLLLGRNISERVMVVVELEDDDLELEVLSNGHVWFQTEEDKFDIRVELDGVDIPQLTVKID